MDTAKCNALITAIETGSLSGAAETLGYTPSGISRMIASLEAELGTPLLVRGKNGVVPTAEGKEFLPVLAELATLGRTCEEKAAALRGLQSGTLRVGSAYRQLYGPLARILAAFSQRYPGIAIDLVQANSSALAEMLARREADFCIMSHRAGASRWAPLLTDAMVAVLPPTHPLAHADAYPLRRFAEDSFIEIYPGQESDNSRVLAHFGIGVSPRFTVFDTHAAFALVEAGLGVTMMNAIYAKSSDADVASVPVKPSVEVAIGVGLPEASLASPALTAFEKFALPRLEEAVGH